MLARRAAQLARCFRLVAMGVGAPALAVQCTSGGSAQDAGDAAAPARDATVEGASGADGAPANGEAAADDGAIEGGVDGGVDGADAACFATVTALDGAGPDGEEVCDFAMPCSLEGTGLTTVGCTVLRALSDGAAIEDASSVGFPSCHVLEGKGCTDGSYEPTESGIEFECIGCPGGGGRRPAGLARGRRRTRGAHALGDWLAEMGRLEAASVRAFRSLASELAAHDAPRALVDACRESARDEAGHARSMRRLARRFGAGTRPARMPRIARASLASIARDNAVEGCVRETYGALVAAWQAAHARDAEVRRAMGEIARDELRHAALAWEIAAWIEPRVSPSARRAIDRARRRAVARLVADASQEIPRALVDAGGLPDARVARELARGLAAQLWLA